jgi:hypothetical protein
MNMDHEVVKWSAVANELTWVWALKCSLMDLFLGLVKVTCAPFPSFAFSNSEFLLSLSFGANQQHS